MDKETYKKAERIMQEIEYLERELHAEFPFVPLPREVKDKTDVKKIVDAVYHIYEDDINKFFNELLERRIVDARNRMEQLEKELSEL